DVAPQFPPLTMWDSVRWGTGHKPSASGAEDDSPPLLTVGRSGKRNPSPPGTAEGLLDAALLVSCPRHSVVRSLVPSDESLGFLVPPHTAGPVRGVCPGWRPKEGRETWGTGHLLFFRVRIHRLGRRSWESEYWRE